MTIAGNKRLVTVRLCSRIKNPYIKNTLCREQSQNPSALMSNLALSVVIAELGRSDTPENGCNTGSIVTWCHTSPNNLAVKSQIQITNTIVTNDSKTTPMTVKTVFNQKRSNTSAYSRQL